MGACLIIIDMINGFVKEGALADKNIASIIPGIAKKAKKFDNIIFVNDAHQENSSEFSSFPPHCVEGSHEAEIVDELKHIKGVVVSKNSVNAMHVYDFVSIIHDLPDDTFYLVGCCADICVLNLALSMKSYFDEHNLCKKVVVIPSLIATYDSADHDAKLFKEMAISMMRANGVTVEEVR